MCPLHRGFLDCEASDVTLALREEPGNGKVIFLQIFHEFESHLQHLTWSRLQLAQPDGEWFNCGDGKGNCDFPSLPSRLAVQSSRDIYSERHRGVVSDIRRAAAD